MHMCKMCKVRLKKTYGRTGIGYKQTSKQRNTTDTNKCKITNLNERYNKQFTGRSALTLWRRNYLFIFFILAHLYIKCE